MIRNLLRLLLVLWAGSLWSVSWVTWVLFHWQGDRHLAGVLAGPLFTFEAYVGVAVAALALFTPARSTFALGFFAASLLALNEWALRPVMASARSHGAMLGLTFGAWHGVSAILYIMACIALVALIWKGGRQLA